MELKKVSFELAKRLKILGFDIKVLDFYDQDKLLSKSSYRELFDWNNDDIRAYAYSAPTLELAKMWFREKHNIKCDSFYNGTSFTWAINNKEYISGYDIYEEALEIGLNRACELIKK